MFIKKRTLLILVVVVISAMIGEWQYVAFRTEVHAVRKYHGLCNTGVGWPYSDFIHRLRTLSESGDTNQLTRALRRADERSRDMFHVWLDDKPDAYRRSIDEILK